MTATMDKEAAFVQAMQAEPQDAALRLVFADWLEEHGDPRAELIRLTHTLTQAIEVPGRSELEAQLQALLHEGVRPVGPSWTNAIGMCFAWVPAGVFLMGSSGKETQRLKDETQHEVALTQGFWLGVHPITQTQWQEVMGNNPSWFCATGGGKAKVKELDTKRFPVEQVSWDDAAEFCSKLAKYGHPAGMMYRLPTEAQWEYACRAATSSAFHFGKSLNGGEANCNGNHPYATRKKGVYLERTSEVGSYPGNAFGLFDMHGNVWEWCQDWYGEYEGGRVQDPPGPQSGSDRVFRGGGWSAIARNCRSAQRFWYIPAYRNFDLGFRLALVPAAHS